MSHAPSAALVVSDASAGPDLLTRLSRQRPDLQWRLCSSLTQAVFELCGGGFALAVVDADHAEPGLEPLLRQVRRCEPATRLVVLAREPWDAAHAAVARCGWLALVGMGRLADALREVR